MKTRYVATMTYSEKRGAHTIVETWKCGSDRQLMSVLTDALDLVKDAKGNPREPDRKELEKNLLPYADEDFVKQEFKRLKAAHDVYWGLISELTDADTVEADVDARTTITVERV